VTSKFTELCVDCRDPQALAAFWSQVLGYDTKTEDDEVFIQGRPGSGPTILFARVPEGKTVKNRLHIDVNPIDRGQGEEVERLEKLGATRVDVGQGKVSWVVMADPEGNEFCVLKGRVSA
jgi:predicted enzyme related to lactoylglutathione lyase